MSAIDTFSYAHVANFCKIPVYWVLEERKLSYLTDKEEDDNKVINKHYLSIGGGSGEHPALILNNDAILWHFLNNIVDIDNIVEPDIEASTSEHVDYKICKLVEEINEKYFLDEEKAKWTIDQNQWPLETFIRADKMLKEESNSHDNLKNKIIDAVALFIINEMPVEHCLQDPKLIEFASLIKSQEWSDIFGDENIYKKFIGFTGVLKCQTSGQVFVNKEVIQSYSLNDWKRDNNY